MFSIVLHADCWLARPTSAAPNAGTTLHGINHVADSRALIPNNRKTASVANVPVEASTGHIDCNAWPFAYRKCCGACKAVTENNSKHPSRNYGENCAAGGSSTMRNVEFWSRPQCGVDFPAAVQGSSCTCLGHQHTLRGCILVEATKTRPAV